MNNEVDVEGFGLKIFELWSDKRTTCTTMTCIWIPFSILVILRNYSKNTCTVHKIGYKANICVILDLTDLVWSFTDEMCQFFDDEYVCLDLQDIAESGNKKPILP